MGEFDNSLLKTLQILSKEIKSQINTNQNLNNTSNFDDLMEINE